MEELKKPTSLLAGTNIIFSAGSFMYFYKRMEQLSAENAELKKGYNNLATKLGQSTVEEKQVEEELRNMKKELKSVKNSIEKIEDQNTHKEVQAIMKALEGNDINVTIPKKEKYKKKKYKYTSSDASTESTESEEKPKKYYKKKSTKELDDTELINLMRKN